jgi:multiple sugar transport system permease protein
MSRHTGLLFALPALVVLFMLIAYPVAYTGLLSVTNNRGELVGLSNFAAVLKPAVTRQAFFNTIYWVVGSIVFQVRAAACSGRLPLSHGSCPA